VKHYIYTFSMKNKKSLWRSGLKRWDNTVTKSNGEGSNLCLGNTRNFISTLFLNFWYVFLSCQIWRWISNIFDNNTTHELFQCLQIMWPPTRYGDQFIIVPRESQIESMHFVEANGLSEWVEMKQELFLSVILFAIGYKYCPQRLTGNNLNPNHRESSFLFVLTLYLNINWYFTIDT
jgi:hypothetical protein